MNRLQHNKFWPTPGDRELCGTETVIQVWPKSPPAGYLHIFVSLPASGKRCVHRVSKTLLTVS